MNHAFEAALAARLLWIEVRCFEGIGGMEKEVEAAARTAFDKVHELALDEVITWQHYGANIPPLLRDVPQLAEHYTRVYELYREGFAGDLEEEQRRHEQEQHMKALAGTYADTERWLEAGWRNDCLDDDIP